MFIFNLLQNRNLLFFFSFIYKHFNFLSELSGIFLGYLSIVCDDLFLNFDPLNFGGILFNNSILSVMTATILYKNFFRYVVPSFNYLSAFSGQAKSWERKKHRHLIQKPLIGFKFVCSVRFSRKQRSSKLICKQGRMPLNTLSA